MDSPDPRPLLAVDGGATYPPVYSDGDGSFNARFPDLVGGGGPGGSVAVVTHTYAKRWYILGIFSLLAFMQSELVNSWTVISDASQAAFGWPVWQISLMQIWIYVTFLLSLFPFASLMDRKSPRLPVLLSAGLLLLGAVLRCMSDQPDVVTWFAHVAHITIGFAGPVVFMGGPVISALWFPSNQRTTATAVSTISGFAGAAGCFLLGPLLVELPKLNTTSSEGVDAKYINLPQIRQEIMFLRYGECAVCAVIFATILIYFPGRPQIAPSISAMMEKVDFKHGLKTLVGRSNRSFWLVCLPYAISTSIYGIWSALFDVNLTTLGVTESEAGWLGFYAVSAGCVAAVIIGRIADLLVGHMKMIALIMQAGSVISTFVFLLIREGYIPFSKAGLFASCITQGIFVNGVIPLYYELAIESSYPVAETVTSSVLCLLYNAFPVPFILTFLIPNVGTTWMNWVMYGCFVASFPMLLTFRERYNRLAVDSCSIRDKKDDPPATTRPRYGSIGERSDQRHVTS